MRPLVLLLALTLGACEDAPDLPATDDRADVLLAPVDRGAVAEAFARLAETGYTADLVVTAFGPNGAVVGRETAVVTADGDEVRVAERTGDGVLAESTEEPLRLRDPIEQALSDDPPYLDPSVREAYQTRALGDTVIDGTTLQRVEAHLVDEARELGIAHVWAAVEAETGQVRAIEVLRRSNSAVFDEVSTVRVDLAPGAAGWRPRRVVTDTQTDVPLSEPRHVRIEWTVRDGR